MHKADPNALKRQLTKEEQVQQQKDIAKAEENVELNELMEKASHSTVPSGWDYLVLPRKINLQRVKPPPLMKEDYFEQVKTLVSGCCLDISIFKL